MTTKQRDFSLAMILPVTLIIVFLAVTNISWFFFGTVVAAVPVSLFLGVIAMCVSFVSVLSFDDCF